MASSSSRTRLAAALLLLLSGCGEGVAPPAGAPPVERISVGFSGLADVIVVSAVDRLPLRRAELINPDGEHIAAYSLDVASSPDIAPSPGEQVLKENPGVPYQVTRFNAMVAKALIRIDDPTRYAKSWRDWRVALHLGDPGSGERDVTLAAPAPPPGS